MMPVYDNFDELTSSEVLHEVIFLQKSVNMEIN